MNWSWIWPCDLEVKGSKSNYWTPEIPSHFCLSITPALMKGVVSYCTQPGRPAPWGWVARICPFQTAYLIFSPFPDSGFILLQKEVLSTWEGSCEHRIYHPIHGTVLMWSIWIYWFLRERESDDCTSFIHGLSTADVWYSGFRLSSCLVPPLASHLFASAAVLSPLRVTPRLTKWWTVADKS